MTLSLRFLRTMAMALTVTAGLLLVVAPAFAQEFAKVNEDAREQLPATPFIGAAYGFIWVAILAYLLVTARKLGRVQGELQDLRRQLERGSARGDDPGTARR